MTTTHKNNQTKIPHILFIIGALLLLFTVVILISVSARADNAIRVTNAAGTSAYPSIATNGNITYLVWHDNRNGAYAIYFNFITADKFINWPNGLRITYGSGDSMYPSLAVDHLGNINVVWQDKRDGNWEIYYKKLDATGTNLTVDERVTNDPKFSLRPSITIDSHNNACIVWYDNRSGNYQVYWDKRVEPDITAVNLNCTPAQPSEGQSVAIKVTVQNLGENNATNIQVQLLIDGTAIETKTISQLNAHTNQILTYNWIGVFGEHDIAIKTDPSNQIAESNEKNNLITNRLNVYRTTQFGNTTVSATVLHTVPLQVTIQGTTDPDPAGTPNNIGTFVNYSANHSFTSAIIKLGYTHAQIGFLSEQSLRIYMWDPYNAQGPRWIPTTEGGVNVVENYIWANVTYFSIFTGIGNILQYSITDLGTLSEAPTSIAYGMNNNDLVVGSSGEENGLQQAFRWENNQMTGLGMLGNGLWSDARAINDAGMIVGSTHRQNPYWLVHAYIWNDGIMTDLNALGGLNCTSYGYDINNNGDTVGTSYLEPRQWQPPHAFLWHDNIMQDLGTLTGDNASVAQAINDNGQIAGISSHSHTDSYHPTAFLWDVTNEMTALPLISGDSHSEAYDINNQGYVVGYSYGSTPGYHGILWKDGLAINLGTLGGTKGTIAYAINNADAIVGSSCIQGTNAQHAFLWLNGMMRDLNSLIPPDSGWVLTEAYDISDDGTIVGYGTNPAGEIHAFVLRFYTPLRVWITNPGPTDKLYEPTWDQAIISDPIIPLKAFAQSGSYQVQSTLFEYSSDNGTTWHSIGLDLNDNFEGYIYQQIDWPWYGGNNKIGSQGWSALWNISALTEGDYLLRATMTDTTGTSSNVIRQICIDRTPPKPTFLTPSYGQEISGTAVFSAVSPATDAIKMELWVYHTPEPMTRSWHSGWYNQSGLGKANQTTTEPGSCVPTATANALAGLKNNKTYPPGKEGNDSAVKDELGKLMKTNNSGTNTWEPTGGPNKENQTDQAGAAIAAYLEKRGIGCSNDSGYDVKVYRVKIQWTGKDWKLVPGFNEITPQKYIDEIRRNQSVIIWGHPYKWNSSKRNNPTLQIDNRSGGHAMTGRGANSEPSHFGGYDISIQDTNNKTFTTNMQNMNSSGYNVTVMKYPPGSQNWFVVTGMIAISPKNHTGGGTSGGGAPSRLGIDTNFNDGLSISVNTTDPLLGLTNGYYTFLAEITDSKGHIGSETVTVRVNNTPWAWITEPMATDFLFEPNWRYASVSKTLCRLRAEDINHHNITSTVFELSNDCTTWETLGVDTFGGFEGYIQPNVTNGRIGSEGWCIIWDTTNYDEGDYYLRATMTAVNGNSHSSIRPIHIDRNPPHTSIVSPAFGTAITGTTMFSFLNEGDNLVNLTLYLVGREPQGKSRDDSSSGWYKQTGLGHAKQGDVGPDITPGRNMYCGPTAIANALAGQKNSKTYPPGQNGNDTATAKELVNDLNTCPHCGTNPWNKEDDKGNISTDNVGNSIKTYLERRGIGCSNKTGYEVKTYGTTLHNNSGTFQPVPGSNNINFQKYNDEIRRNQSVILFYREVDEGPDGRPGTADDNITGDGHYVTGEGANADTATGEGGATVGEISYVDPADGESKEDVWFDGPTNGFSYFRINGKYYLILGMWAISEKGTGGGPSGGGFHKGPQTSNVLVNTVELGEGYATIIAQLDDTSGYIATTTTTVLIDNSDPWIWVNPLGGIVDPTTIITLTADDQWSGVASITYTIAWDSDGDGLYDQTFASGPILASEVTFSFSEYGITQGLTRLEYFATDDVSRSSDPVYQEYEVVGIEPPRVSITEPAGTGILYDKFWQQRIISDPVITVRAFDSSFLGNIISTTFEYSTDGSIWNPIGIDTSGEFEGFLLTEGQNRKIGDEGWSTVWDLTGFPKGPYQLKASMDSDLDEHVEHIQNVYYDPTPAIPEITFPLSLQPISSTVAFTISPPPGDSVSLGLLLYNQYQNKDGRGPDDGWFNQSSLGGLKQEKVGPAGSDGQNRWCGPTAAANALKGQSDNRLYPPGKIGNLTAVAREIARLSNADKNTGTNTWKESTSGTANEFETDNFGSSLRQYLNDRGVGCNNPEGYEITTYGIKAVWNAAANGLNAVAGSNTATFEAYNNEIRKGQAVILAMMKMDPGPDWTEYTADDVLSAGHSVSGRGANSNANADGSHTVSTVDPATGQPQNLNWETHNGFSYLNYDSSYYMITGMWAISKKDTTSSTTPVDYDYDPVGGLTVSWDSHSVPDGYYTLQTLLTDSNNEVGTDTVVVLVDNTPPICWAEPPGGTVSPTTPIWLHATDSGSGVQFIFYQIWHDGILINSQVTLGSDVEIILANYYITSGNVEIHYYAHDNAGNMQQMQFANYIVIPEGDATPPISYVQPSGQPFPGFIIPSSALINIYAEDDLGGSGVNYIHYEILVEGIQKCSLNIPGNHITFLFSDYGIPGGLQPVTTQLIYYAVDNAGNHELMHETFYLVTPTPGKVKPPLLSQNLPLIQ
jgi:probable HAF family extracellular repeat protein